jgi:hypothetical protein
MYVIYFTEKTTLSHCSTIYATYILNAFLIVVGPCRKFADENDKLVQHWPDHIIQNTN